MKYTYLEYISKNIKSLIHNKYILKILVTLLLTLCVFETPLLLSYIKTKDHTSEQKIVETNNDEELDEDISVPEEVEQQEEEVPEKIEEKANTTPSYPSKQTNTETEKEEIPTETPVEQPPEEEPVEEPPIPESPTAVVAFYADTQSDTDQEDLNHQRVVNYILSSGANPVFHAGDVMEDGTQASLDRFNTVTSTLRSARTFYAALGNNDRAVGDSSTPSQLFLDNFSYPNNERWYSVNYGNLHLVVLDSAFGSGNVTQLNWLTNDLQSSNSQNRITGVMYHHPTFASSISSFLINYGVDFVVAGHIHSYGHSISNGINYFTLSGQPSIGYMVARIYSDKVSITVYNSSNALIDSIEFNER